MTIFSTNTSDPKPLTSYRWLVRFAITLLFMGALLVSALGCVLFSERGSKQLWDMAGFLTGNQLKGQWGGGTWAKGIQLTHIDYEHTTTHIQLDKVEGAWQVSVSPLKISIPRLHLGTLKVAYRPSNKTSPSVLPKKLTLPFALEAQDLMLDKFLLSNGNSETNVEHIQLSAESDGQHHHINLKQLDTQHVSLSADTKLDGLPPLKLTATAQLNGHYAIGESKQEAYQAQMQASGTLEHPLVQLDVTGDKLNGRATLLAAPYSPVMVERAQLSMHHLNPKVLWTALPSADLDVQALLAPESSQQSKVLKVNGTVEIKNALPGLIDKDRFPINSIHAQLALTEQSQKIQALSVHLFGNGLIEGTGEWIPSLQKGALGSKQSDSKGKLVLQAKEINLSALYSGSKESHIQGTITTDYQPQLQSIGLELVDRNVRLSSLMEIDSNWIQLKQLHFNMGQTRTAGSLELEGKVSKSKSNEYAFKGKMIHVDPSIWNQWVQAKNSPTYSIQSGDVNMRFEAEGSAQPVFRSKAQLTIEPSSYNHMPMTGGGTIEIVGKQLLPSHLQMMVAGNQFGIEGRFGRPEDKMNVHIHAPMLERLGLGVKGSIELNGQCSGSINTPTIRASYHMDHVVLGTHRLEKLEGQADIQTKLDAKGIMLEQSKVQTNLHMQRYAGPGVDLADLSVNLSGTLAQHKLALQTRGNIQNKSIQVATTLEGGVLHRIPSTLVSGVSNSLGYGWKGKIQTFQQQGVATLRLLSPLSIMLQKDSIQLDNLQLQAAESTVNMPHLEYQDGLIQSTGTARNLQVGLFLKWYQDFTKKTFPVSSDLVLDSDWNIHLGRIASTGFIGVKRRQGDVQIDRGYGKKALGISKLETKAVFSGNTVHADMQLVIPTATLSVKGESRLPDWNDMEHSMQLAPFSSQLKLNVPEIKRLSSFMDPNFSSSGQLQLDVQANGTLAEPKWKGVLQGNQLSIMLFDQGIQLRNGLINVVFSDRDINLKQVEFHGGNGTIRAEGHIQLGQTNPTVKAKLVAEQLQLYADPKRTLVLSGQADIANKSELFQIDGRFTIDRGFFDLPKNTPQLGDDVVIIESESQGLKTKKGKGQSDTAKMTKNIAPRYPIQMNLLVNLGQDLRFKGGDADLLLRGTMQVNSAPQQPFSAKGTIRVAEGTYEVFGKKLSIEKGLIHFNGPLDNPNMTILAMRRNMDVEPGVEVTGTAKRPRARLVSEPNVPDEEKLSWLLLGHGLESSDKGQQQAVGAALGFLANSGGKHIANRVGLDEISLGASRDVGTVGNDQQLVHLGKAISDRFYVGYEQSLDGATTLVKATWRISKRWSLVVRTGVINSFDVLFNKRYDEVDF